MTKAEYLEELRTGLEERFTPGETADILAEYASFFESGQAEGRTEEAVAAALGSPAALVRLLTAERMAPAVPPASGGSEAFAAAPILPPRASLGRRIAALLIDRLFLFAVIVLFTAGGWLIMKQTAEPILETEDWSSGTIVVRDDEEAHIEVRRQVSAAVMVIPLLILLGTFVPQLAVPLTVTLILERLFYTSGGIGAGGWLAGALLFGMLLTLLYKPALECLWNGRTIGKRILRIRVAAPDGGRAGAGRILTRELIGDSLLGGLTGGVTTVVSIFTAAIGKERKSVPDYIASTVVVPDIKS